MTATITVQGTHTAWFDAERATVHISATFDGPKRDEVFARATQTAADVTALITPLHDAAKGPVTWWSSDRIRVWAQRPWNSEGKQLAPVHHAAIQVTVKFNEFDALADWLTDAATVPGVQVNGIEWTLT